MDYFGEDLHWNVTDQPERYSGSGTSISVGECVVPLDIYSPVRVGTYKQFLTSQVTVPVEVTEANFESVKYAMSFEKRHRKKRNFEVSV